MHDTLHPSVRGYIDSITITEIRGWAFHTELNTPPMRILCNGISYTINRTPRQDVANYYKKSDIIECGWTILLTPTMSGVIFIQIQIHDDWVTVFEVAHPVTLSTINTATTKKKLPSYLVVDNFYENPDDIRTVALAQNFSYHPGYHKGQRTDNTFLFPGLKERFEELLGVTIDNWQKYGTNGCFQYCIGGDQLVYHVDTQMYAAVLFLTPDAPPECGTSMFRSKHNKRMKPGDAPNVMGETFAGGFLDRSHFDLVDVIGNVYNRIVIFDAQIIHAASQYFGTTKTNGRLFQLFFFDIVQ
jgi:hypothetical protein